MRYIVGKQTTMYTINHNDFPYCNYYTIITIRQYQWGKCLQVHNFTEHILLTQGNYTFPYSSKN